jgi:ATP-dependent Clp protease ATP-binding subunit ClpC
MEFNFKKSKIYKAVQFSKILPYGFLKFWRVFCLVIGFVCLSIFGLLYFQEIFLVNILFFNLFSLSDSYFFLGLSYILIPIGFSILFLEIYYNQYLKYPKIISSNNLADFLDFEAAMSINDASLISLGQKENLVSADNLFLSIINNKKNDYIFIRLGIDPNILRGQFKTSRLKNFFFRTLFSDFNPQFSDDFKELMRAANTIRLKHNGDLITLTDLLASLFDYNIVFRKSIINIGLDKEDLESLSNFYESLFEFIRKQKEFWRLENLLRSVPIGVNWIYGYSRYLNQYTYDITAKFYGKKNQFNLIGRQNIVDQIEQILAKSGQNNILLVGEPGIGKKSVINGLAQLISAGKALPSLNYKKVFELNISEIVSLSQNTNELQRILINILNETIKAGNIILVIEDFHNFIGALEGMGRIDISQVLMPYLESTRLQIIATTDPISFHKFIESRADLMKVFEKVEMEEPDLDLTLKIIEEIIPVIEHRFKILFTYPAIKYIVKAADRYITYTPFPEKAVDLLNDMVGWAQSNKKQIIFPDDVNKLLTIKTNIPLGDITKNEKEKLINLESEMRKIIIGQEQAVKVIAQTMQRLRAGLIKRNKPSGVFLFIGPTGVGKTLTAKVLAKIYFGSQERIIRFDMSEYQDAGSLDRFLGSLSINEPGQLASKVRDEPFSVILLDELEKAHKNILNVFLAVFDEGKMTDVFGRKVNFEQSIIIATSNAAADTIRNMVNQGLDPAEQKEKIIDILIRDKYFSPEFLNRFDEIVIFHPLNQENIFKIAQIIIGELVERLRSNGFFFKPTEEIIKYITDVGFDPQFGARPMQRAVQDKIETIIARKIIEGSISKGKEFTLSVNDLLI